MRNTLTSSTAVLCRPRAASVLILACVGGGELNRRDALKTSSITALAALSQGAAPAQAAKKPPAPQEVQDRRGAPVSEAQWLEDHPTQPDLVLGLDGEPYFLVKDPAATGDTPALAPYALRAECTHLGCLVAANPLGDGFTCPCHGSKYARDGTVLRGPAPSNLRLARLETREKDSKLVMSPWAEPDFRGFS